jgi:hypothetical protein
MENNIRRALIIILDVMVYIVLAVADWLVSSWLADSVVRATSPLDVALKIIFFCVIGAVAVTCYRTLKSGF